MNLMDGPTLMGVPLWVREYCTTEDAAAASPLNTAAAGAANTNTSLPTYSSEVATPISSPMTTWPLPTLMCPEIELCRRRRASVSFRHACCVSRRAVFRECEYYRPASVDCCVRGSRVCDKRGKGCVLGDRAKARSMEVKAS